MRESLLFPFGSLSAALAALALLPIGAAAGGKMSGGDIVLLRHESGSAGRQLQGAAVLAHNAVGQTGFTTFSGASARVQGGLMPHIAQPGSVVALTAVTKSTGTLELSWLAPGRDGAQGPVAGGTWRVAYSSDATRSFAPTSFDIELATDAAPGERRSVQLEGLEPNTTYYARVYLGDSFRNFSEDSAPGAESSLTNKPVDPVAVEVSSTHVVLRWLLPPGGARGGYRMEGSSTAFAGGDLLASSTADGSALALTVDGLITDTTYFFRVAGLNSQGDPNYTLLVVARTGLSGKPLAILHLGGATDALGRSVAFNWGNPVYFDPEGVLVLLSTNPAPVPIPDGTVFAPGQVLADGSVVKSTAMATAFRDGGLLLDSTWYYHLFSQGGGIPGEGPAPRYSTVVTTAVFLDLPPMAPAGLAQETLAGGTQVRLSWSPVVSNLDGERFRFMASSNSVELAHYEIWRATSIFFPSFVRLSTVPVGTLSYIDSVPDPNGLYLYRITSIDSFNTSEPSMAVGSDGDLFVFSPDKASHIRVPRDMVGELRGVGEDTLLRSRELPSDPSDPSFRNVIFEAVRSPRNEAVRYEFSRPDVKIALRYEVAGGRVVQPGALAAQGGGTPAQGASPAGDAVAIPSADAAGSLAMYWDNGAKFIKLFGDVDTANQTVSVRGPYTGNFQIRGLLREKGFAFDVSTLSNKFITPNGDGLNDTAAFLFDNPKDSAFSGRIFDRRGRYVADMAPGPQPRKSLQWDGLSGGRAVPGGVYVYRIEAEGKAFSGTLVVIR